MQTRKRAKSVSFGKKKKEKEENEPVKTAAVEEVASSVDEKAPEKAEVAESKESHAAQTELSATPPKNEEEESASPVETPVSEFVSDSPLSTSPELPNNSKVQDEPTVIPEQPVAENSDLSKPAEPETQPTSTPEPQAGQPDSEELSSTLPPSAFTIQSSEQPAQQAAPEQTEAVPEKKRFGLYFLVVAFLAFVLGLGAMAGASYLGLVNVNLSKLPSGIHVPGLLGQKPTPTVLPPTAAPTQKPVDLTAYTITVLNGSGISGKAADVKTSLTTAGFKVSSTGNADKSTYTKTEISAKSTVNHDYLIKLEDELNKSYTVDTTVATSPDSDATDITVTLGQPSSQ